MFTSLPLLFNSEFSVCIKIISLQKQINKNPQKPLLTSGQGERLSIKHTQEGKWLHIHLQYSAHNLG